MIINVKQGTVIGAIFVFVGALFVYLSSKYTIGTALNMGAGFLPMMLAGTLFALGVIQLIRSRVSTVTVDLHITIPLIASLSIIGMVFILPYVGMLIAVFLMMLITGKLHKDFTLQNFLISYTVVSAMIIAYKLVLGGGIPLWIP